MLKMENADSRSEHVCHVNHTASPPLLSSPFIISLNVFSSTLLTICVLPLPVLETGKPADWRDHYVHRVMAFSRI